ncbi:MAG TPA: site-2 protease family protein [Candidatus Acidoferrum sp.]|nr:site-2 protease family protein [Candidatus Acidoferrum sp.]
MPVGSLFGIRIVVDPSWVFIFALIAWSLADPQGPLHRTDLSASGRIALGILGSLLFFVSVLLHELSHSLVAQTRGVRVSEIRLFIFGGVSVFEGEARDAPAEAWISVVGPLTSLVLGAALFGCASVLGPNSTIGALLGYLAYVNLALALFNILPAYPMDGGRVLHSVVWRITGNRERASDVTVRVGRVFAGLIVAFGIFEALAFNVGAGLWTTFIGWFLLQAGGAEASRVAITRALRGHLAGELALPPDVRIEADTPASRALEVMRAARVRSIPVVLGDRILGVVTEDALANTPPDDLQREYATALMTRIDEIDSLPATSPADDVIQRVGKNRAGAVALTDPKGTIAGIVTADSVLSWLSRSGSAA